MKKILPFAGALAIAVLIGFALKNQIPKSQNQTKKIRVIATIFPLYDIAKNIAADKAEVSLLLPAGVEAHSFEPKPSDIVKIREAAIFTHTGKFMEPWAEDIAKSANNRDLLVIDASRNVRMLPNVFEDADEPVGSLDPHFWLNFDNVQTIIQTFKAAFIAKDAANAAFYERNADIYAARLNELDNRHKTILADCERKEIIYAGHYAFGYLAERYGLKYLAAQGISPDSEPTAEDLINLVEQIKKNGVEYLFYEELTSPEIAETLARETSVKMLVLNPAHNLSKTQFEQGVSFFDIMNANLENLKIGLNCR